MTSPTDRRMATESGEEFCAEPPWLGLVGFHIGVFFCWLGVALTPLMLIAVGMGVCLGIAQWWKLPLVAACGALCFLAVRGSRRTVRIAKELSVSVDSSTIRVADAKGRRYWLDFVDIKELRVSTGAMSHYLLSTPRLVVVTRSGEEHDLPLRLRDRAALVDRIVGSAGLDRHTRETRWDVYSPPA